MKKDKGDSFLVLFLKLFNGTRVSFMVMIFAVAMVLVSANLLLSLKDLDEGKVEVNNVIEANGDFTLKKKDDYILSWFSNYDYNKIKEVLGDKIRNVYAINTQDKDFLTMEYPGKMKENSLTLQDEIVKLEVVKDFERLNLVTGRVPSNKEEVLITDLQAESFIKYGMLVDKAEAYYPKSYEDIINFAGNYSLYQDGDNSIIYKVSGIVKGNDKELGRFYIREDFLDDSYLSSDELNLYSSAVVYNIDGESFNPFDTPTIVNEEAITYYNGTGLVSRTLGEEEVVIGAKSIVNFGEYKLAYENYVKENPDLSEEEAIYGFIDSLGIIGKTLAYNIYDMDNYDLENEMENLTTKDLVIVGVTKDFTNYIRESNVRNFLPNKLKVKEIIYETDNSELLDKLQNNAYLNEHGTVITNSFSEGVKNLKNDLPTYITVMLGVFLFTIIGVSAIIVLVAAYGITKLDKSVKYDKKSLILASGLEALVVVLLAWLFGYVFNELIVTELNVFFVNKYGLVTDTLGYNYYFLAVILLSLVIVIAYPIVTLLNSKGRK